MSEAKELVRQLYKDEAGNPINLCPGQVEIFEAIAMKKNPRVQIMCHTRYGKSLTVALAVLTRVATFPEKWCITAGSKDKARIIMNYVNTHIFDNDYTSAKFVRQKGEKDEELKRHRNKNHITFNLGNGKMGELFIASAKEAIGLGAPNVVEDEASLIDDNDHSMVLRMLGDNPDDNFLCKIGNPFLRNHFLKSHLDPAYEKINIDCYRSLEEGRITRATIEENRPYNFFGTLFENKFPDANSIDEKGWLSLLSENEIIVANGRQQEHYGRRRLGVDIARGGRDYNVFTLRGENYAKVLRKTHESDLMAVAGQVIEFIREHHIIPEDVYIDDTGVGGGVTDRLREQGYNVTAVTLGGSPTIKTCVNCGEEVDKSVDKCIKCKHEVFRIDYVNIRAQLYACRTGLANWVKRVGYLFPHADWEEMTRIRYKKDSSGKLKIEAKDDMRSRGEHSPDVADSLMLTFLERPVEKQYRPLNPLQILQAGGNNGQFGGVGESLLI